MSSFFKFVFSWLLIMAIFAVNEIILRQAMGIDSLFVKPSQLIPYVSLAAGITLLATRKSIVWSLALIAVLQLIWFGAIAYFGNVLTPDIIILGFSQLFELGIAAESEWHLFIVPVFLVTAVNLVLGFVVLKLRQDRSQKMQGLALFLLILPFVVISARAFLHYRPLVLNRSPCLPSQTGTVQSFSLAIRNIVADASLSDGGAAKVVFGQKSTTPPTEPVTVALIMGESITPWYLGFLGQGKTSPLMTKRMSRKGALTYFPKIGISAGVSTLGSVPLYIRMSHNPVAAFRRKNTIFQLAKENGFSVGYYSAQNIKPLQIGGGLGFIDKIETKENWQDEYDKKQDAILLDQMDKSPIDGDRRFYFIHQRTNHTPYICYDKKLQAKGEALFSKNIGNDNAKRLARYRGGLLCYDKSLDQLLARLEKRPGALFVFIVSDHNELMGVNGLWGHSHLILQNSIVPMMLATNRPDSDVAKAFEKLDTPNAFNFVRLVTKALGQEISLDKPSNKIFVNGVIAYGRRGYLEIEKTDNPVIFSQTLVDAATSYRRTKQVEAHGLAKMLDFVKKYRPIK